MLFCEMAEFVPCLAVSALYDAVCLAAEVLVHALVLPCLHNLPLAADLIRGPDVHANAILKNFVDLVQGVPLVTERGDIHALHAFIFVLYRDNYIYLQSSKRSNCLKPTHCSIRNSLLVTSLAQWHR
jgi:hypothetical protein